MASAETVGKNTFTWIDLGTTDLEAAKAFYGELFPWKTKDMDAGEGGIYTEAYVEDQAVAGLYELNADMRSQGIPAHWMSYLHVEDVDAKAKQAGELGGKVVKEPFDVMDAGRMAVVQDPTGATFALWQAKKHTGAGLFNEPGTLTWNELMTSDVGKVRDFYTRLLGWKADEHDMGGVAYTMFMNGDRPAAGAMAIASEMGDVPPNWGVYLAVDEVDGYCNRAKGKGAKILAGPLDTGVGRMATVQDPQGAVFSIIKLDKKPDA